VVQEWILYYFMVQIRRASEIIGGKIERGRVNTELELASVWALRGCGVDLVNSSSARTGNVLSRDDTFELLCGRTNGSRNSALDSALVKMEVF
jgi:hypothetical protein